ncbi:MAG: S41 family peptidase, partial [Ktedonobacteraceae bacterium]
MTPEALVYLHEGLDSLQKNSIKREQIDWQALRQEVCALVEEAQTPADTYPALEIALKRLGDHHSFFRDPSKHHLLQAGKVQQFGLTPSYPEGIVGVVAPGSPAEQAGVQVGDRIERINDQPFATLTREQFKLALRQAQLNLTLFPAQQEAMRQVHLQATPFSALTLPQGQRLAHAIGYLNLPGFLGSREQNKTYAETAQRLIGEIDQATTCGWVIDLRGNTGGNMWPMVAGVGPILGEGAWVAFEAPWEKRVAFYRGGQAGIEPDEVLSEVDQPTHLKRPEPPVAVLTSRLTASSGEFTALAFWGLPRVRTFGEPTAGLPTANRRIELSDGAMIALTVSLGADRTGRVYE